MLYIYIISTLYVSYPLNLYILHFYYNLRGTEIEKLEIQGINNLPKVIQLFSSRTRIGISGSYTM